VDLSDLDLTVLPWEGSRDTDPVWIGDVIYFLSDRDLAMNVYSYDTADGSLRQVTHYSEYDCKNLEAGGGVLIYENGGSLHVHDPADGSVERLEVSIRADLPWTRPSWESVGNSITEAVLGPTGTRAMFVARGEIFTVPVDEGDWRNLSRSSGSREIAPTWSPDGTHVAWFSDEAGEYQLVIGEQTGLGDVRTIEIDDPTFAYDTAWSPDGSKILFINADRELSFVDVETGERTRVDGDTYAAPDRSMDPVWSPDGRWIAYARRLDSQLRAIFVCDTTTGAVHQLTDGMADAISPVFDRDGTMLYFLASTDFGMNTGWLDMSSYPHETTRSVYAIILDDETASPLLPKSDEEPARDLDAGKEKDDASDEAADESADGGESNDDEDAAAAPEEDAAAAGGEGDADDDAGDTAPGRWR